MSSAPDFAEPLIGWRGWRVGPDGLLASLTTDVVWRPNQPLRAVCQAHRHEQYLWEENPYHHHAAPFEHCTCGVYAVKSIEQVTYAAHALGTVKLWGRVIVADNGFRAELAYPERLFVFGYDAIVNNLDQYDVPVEELTSKQLRSLGFNPRIREWVKLWTDS